MKNVENLVCTYVTVYTVIWLSIGLSCTSVILKILFSSGFNAVCIFIAALSTLVSIAKVNIMKKACQRLY